MDALISRTADSLDRLNENIINQSIKDSIPSFAGQQDKFKAWIAALEKHAVLRTFDSDQKITAAYMSSEGAVSEFIYRWRQETQDNQRNWDNLLQSLTTLFSPVADADHAHEHIQGSTCFSYSHELDYIGENLVTT